MAAGEGSEHGGALHGGATIQVDANGTAMRQRGVRGLVLCAKLLAIASKRGIFHLSCVLRRVLNIPRLLSLTARPARRASAKDRALRGLDGSDFAGREALRDAAEAPPTPPLASLVLRIVVVIAVRSSSGKSNS